MSTIRHQVHVMPRLRRVGGTVLPEWLAITLGHHIFAWRELSATELRHELQHVRQWARYGITFPLLYLVASVRSLLTGGGWYRGNRYEVEARSAERAPSAEED